jgi:hypothetical protein
MLGTLAQSVSRYGVAAMGAVGLQLLFLVRWCLSSSVSQHEEFGRRGGGPGKVGASLVGGRARSSGAGRCHGREGGVVLGEQCAVAVAREPSGRRPVPYVGGVEVYRGETLALPWAAVSASADVVSFLKASSR